MDIAVEVMSILEHLAVIFAVPDQELPPVVEVTADIIKAELSDYISVTFVWKVRKISVGLRQWPFPLWSPFVCALACASMASR